MAICACAFICPERSNDLNPISDRVTAAGDNTAIVWDAAKRERMHVLEHDTAVYAASISPDGKQIATASGEGVVAIWNTHDGAKGVHAKRHEDSVYCVAFSPDGQFVASAGGSTDGGDTVCRICRASDLKVISEFSDHKRQVYGVGRHSGSEPSPLRLCEKPRNTQLRLIDTVSASS